MGDSVVARSMAKMTEDEIRAFLVDGTRTAKVATTRPGGRPHVAPVWFLMDDDGRVVFTTGATSVKGRRLQRDPRVALAVDNQRPPYSYVVVEGTASISEDPTELLDWATRIGGRYMGADRAEQYGRRNAVVGELLIRVEPTRIIGERDVAG
jgi:PPOX class probable F420-dependent enzyme